MFQGSGRAISALTRGDYKQKDKRTPFSYFLISTEIFNISTIISTPSLKTSPDKKKKPNKYKHVGLRQSHYGIGCKSGTQECISSQDFSGEPRVHY